MSISLPVVGWLAFAPILVVFCIAIWKSKILSRSSVMKWGFGLWAALFGAVVVPHAATLLITSDVSATIGWIAYNLMVFVPLLGLIMLAGLRVHYLRTQVEERSPMPITAS